jgi:ABC-type transport system substrate-binding protein
LKDEYAYNPTAAKKLLADAGYPNGFKTNVVADIAWDMDLIQIIKSYFAQVGIDMEIRIMVNDDILAFVGVDPTHELVWREYGPLGHTYSPFQAITRFNTKHFGNMKWLNVDDTVIDAFYTKALAATTEDEMKQIMRDMNERVVRQHFAISLLQPMVYNLYQPWLKGYHGQIHSVWMSMGGPSRLSLYGARFWIDRKLKKSMGH